MTVLSTATMMTPPTHDAAVEICESINFQIKDEVHNYVTHVHRANTLSFARSCSHINSI